MPATGSASRGDLGADGRAPGLGLDRRPHAVAGGHIGADGALAGAPRHPARCRQSIFKRRSWADVEVISSSGDGTETIVSGSPNCCRLGSARTV
jgi:hypothetical protein